MILLLALMLAQPTPLIVDTDAGTDDLLAIAYLLARTDVHIEAITVVSGVAHVHEGALNILHLLDVAGRRDIAVYEGDSRTPAGGHDFPAEWRKPSDEVFGPHPTQRTPVKGAAEFLKARLQKPCQILALGPLTNIAAALGSGNSIAQLIIMGGAVRVAGNVDASPQAEWNIYADPLAAQKVFDFGIPIQLIPLDATNRVPIDAGYVNLFVKEATTPLGKVAAQVLKTSPPPFAWDPLAAVALTNPEVVSYSALSLHVNEAGRTMALPGKPNNAQAALNANPAMFQKLFLEAFKTP
jgi:pyrimidine-specific ribonucleoside hydrolase